jgi:hypothetical protein
MSQIRLGLPGLEYVLPEMRYPVGGEASIGMECQKNVQEATMADGSLRVNISAVHPSTFGPFEFDKLSLAEAAPWVAMAKSNVELSLINEYTDGLAYRVFVKSWGLYPISYTTGRAVPLYKLTLELKGTGTVV